MKYTEKATAKFSISKLNFPFTVYVFHGQSLLVNFWIKWHKYQMLLYQKTRILGKCFLCAATRPLLFNRWIVPHNTFGFRIVLWILHLYLFFLFQQIFCNYFHKIYWFKVLTWQNLCRGFSKIWLNCDKIKETIPKICENRHTFHQIGRTMR